MEEIFQQVSWFQLIISQLNVNIAGLEAFFPADDILT